MRPGAHLTPRGTIGAFIRFQSELTGKLVAGGDRYTLVFLLGLALCVFDSVNLIGKVGLRTVCCTACHLVS